MKPFTFDWQRAPRNSFIGWFLPMVIRNEDMDRVGDLTDKFTNVQVTMQVNGVEVDAEHFFQTIEDQTVILARQQARLMIAGPLRSLRDLAGEMVDEIETQADQKLSELFDVEED